MSLHDPLLAFDTSTERMAVALVHGASVWVDDRAGGAAASATLLPAIHGLLERAGMSFRDLAAIAFGRGPGAFTGLRTSCAVAQGLAFALGRPVLPIDSLLIVAEQARQALQAGFGGIDGDLLDVGVAMDARMGEVYAARYRAPGLAGADGPRWQVVQPPALWSPDALAAEWQSAPPRLRVGSALAIFDRLADDPGPNPPATDPDAGRAAALAALAARAWADGAGVDAAGALPVYLRDRVALTTAERAAAKAAAAAA